MASHFGWVDLTEDDRQQMLDIISLFREQDTVDELGIGKIRDAFSDYLFPGTSTIQTRARYMLFVPWIYQDLERREIASEQIAARARRDEVRLIFALLKSGETDGVIGRDAREKLKRLPSSIYWQGMAAWGIRLFKGSQDQYHRSLDGYYRRQRRIRRNDDSDLVEIFPPNWDPGLPQAPPGFLDKTTFHLTKEEALYLKDKIQVNHGSSLLYHLIERQELVECSFPWEVPRLDELPAHLQAALRHA